MNRKTILEERKKKLEGKRDELVKRSDESTDLNEVKSLADRIRDVVDAIKDCENELMALADEEDKGKDKDGNSNPDGAAGDNAQRGFNPMGTYAVRGGNPKPVDPTDTMEYRRAFMEYVVSGKPIPAEVRGDAVTTTDNAGGVIPSTVADRIVERMELCGMILPLVTRTSFKSGVVVPTSSVKPVATWVAEGASSDTQSKPTGSVTFSHFKLRCEVATSMEVGTMAVSAFETTLVKNVADAMVIAIEKAILAGDGASQPKGILKETPASTIQIASNVPTYKELCAIEGAIPVTYETTAKWCMTKPQFMQFLSMTDSAGQPIARVNYGVSGKPERTILGRDVVIHPYATEMGSNVAFVFDFADYALNTIYDLGIQRKQDWDTEDYRTKAVMSCDGKALNVGSLVAVTVKGA